MPGHFSRTMDFDAVTLSPYMGRDSIEPFPGIRRQVGDSPRSHVNSSAEQFQLAEKDGKPLYRAVMEEMMSISSPDKHDVRRRCDKGGETCRNQDVLPGQFPSCPGCGGTGRLCRGSDETRGQTTRVASSSILPAAYFTADSTQNFAKSAAKVASQTARIL